MAKRLSLYLSRMVQTFGLIAPGQIISNRLNVSSLFADESVRDILLRQQRINEDILGDGLAKRVQLATPEQLKEDTRTGQLVAYSDTMAFIFALMYHTSGKLNDIQLIERLRHKDASLALSADSCGNVTAAYFPIPTFSLPQNLTLYGVGLAAMEERASAVEKMPHPQGGGLAIVKVDLETAVKLCNLANMELGRTGRTMRDYRSEPQAKVTKTNTPLTHAISASKGALDIIKREVVKLTGDDKNYIYLTSHRFHDPEFMTEAATEWAMKMGQFWVPRPSFAYISNTDGDIHHFGRTVKRQLVASVKQSINLNTGRDESVVGALKNSGVKYAVVFNTELVRCLKGTGITTLLAKDLDSLVDVKREMYSLISASHSPQLSHSTTYLARS